MARRVQKLSHHHHLCFGRQPKAGRRKGKNVVEREGVFRYALTGGCKHRDTIGEQITNGVPCDGIGVYIWLSVVGPMLEARTKVKEAENY